MKENDCLELEYYRLLQKIFKKSKIQKIIKKINFFRKRIYTVSWFGGNGAYATKRKKPYRQTLRRSLESERIIITSWRRSHQILDVVAKEGTNRILGLAGHLHPYSRVRFSSGHLARR